MRWSPLAPTATVRVARAVLVLERQVVDRVRRHERQARRRDLGGRGLPCRGQRRTYQQFLLSKAHIPTYI